MQVAADGATDPMAPSFDTHPTLSIVVPTFREVENIPILVARITSALASAGENAYEIIIVDDNSQDGTEKAVSTAAAGGHSVRLITRTQERGLSSAVIRGFTEARGDILVCMDADLSHPPEALPQLIDTLRGDPSVDFVIGSRYVPGAGTDQNWGMFRWLNSKVATLMARPFTSARDPMAGYFALPRSVFARAGPLNPIGYKIGLELMVKCRCRKVREVPIYFADRKRGESKLNLKEQISYIRHLKHLADYRYGGFSQLAQFCLVGLTGMAVDLSSLALLLHAAVPFKIARALAIFVAMTTNFILNRRMTFSHSRGSGVIAQYFRFVATCTLGGLVSWRIAVGLVQSVPFFRGHVFLASVAGILVGTIFNFLISRHWVFRRQARSTP
jgi:dolichol-phosphate mannosyltransferase